VANGTSCADSNACNGLETCQGGTCAAGTPLDCNDANVCTVDSCLPLSGCQHAAVANGTSCADGTVCNGAETCQTGVCIPGTPLNCDDANACTADTCDPTAGCQHAGVANGTSCADGNVCNGGEVCQSGTCTAGTPLDCNDANPCTTDTCDMLLGCQHVALPDLTPCNAIGVCVGGLCL
jgi:hypothetical protein